MRCNSLMGWLGGKTRLRPTIISCIPPHFCFIEMFAGSATVFFGKPPEISKSEIINDIHGELVNLMKVISGVYFDESVRQEFISYVRNMPAARSVFEDWKHWDEEQTSKLSPAQRAFRFYYCVKKGFSSTPKGGYESSPFSSNRYNMNTDFDIFAERFRASNAQVECLDFRDLVAKYNNPRADVFFFIDPPYFIANDTNYYEHVFTSDDHQNLFQDCVSIDANKNKFLITYDDVKEVFDLYHGFYIYRTDPIVYKAMSMEVQSEKEKTELFVCNYNIADFLKKRADKRDIFEESNIKDDRIEFEGCLGITRVN